MTDNSKKIRLKIARLGQVNKANERSIKRLKQKLDKIQDDERRKKRQIRNAKTRQFTINQNNSSNHNESKKKRGLLNFLRMPNFRRKTQKKSLLPSLSQSVTNLSNKIPQTTTKTTEIVTKMV